MIKDKQIKEILIFIDSTSKAVNALSDLVKTAENLKDAQCMVYAFCDVFFDQLKKLSLEFIKEKENGTVEH